MYILLPDRALNISQIPHIFIRRFSDVEWSVLAEVWGPIVCLKRKRYKEYNYELYRGPKDKCELFLKALMELESTQEAYVTVDYVIEFMDETVAL